MSKCCERIHVSYLRHSTYTGRLSHPIKIRCYKMNRAYGSATIDDNDITEKIKDKIFQPFFTTKPTGEGTGLGLSLSYDIVRVHSGELKLENLLEGQSGTVFVIRLPKI